MPPSQLPVAQEGGLVWMAPLQLRIFLESSRLSEIFIHICNSGLTFLFFVFNLLFLV